MSATGGNVQLQLIVDVLTHNQQTLNQIAQNIAAIGAASQQSTAPLQSLHSAFTGLNGALIDYYKVLGSLEAIKTISAPLSGFIKGGVDFNASMEQSKISIQALIASIAEMRDAQGNLIVGSDKYAVSAGIVEEQLKKLQIDAANTSNTFEELRQGFQAGIGPGLAAGLNLDQIRELTMRIANAAKTWGMATDQVAQEIRAVLSGSIDADAQLAKGLGITNEMVKKWKEQGVLGDQLLAKFEQFAVAGEDVSKSWSGVTSNFKDLISQMQGSLTQGFFDNLKSGLNEAFSGLIDKGQFSAELEGLVVTGRALFDQLGEGIASAIRVGIDSLKEFSQWMDTNKDALLTLGQSAGGVASQIASLAGKISDLLGFLVTLGTQSNSLASTLGLLRIDIAGCEDGMKALGIVILELGSFISYLLARIPGISAGFKQEMLNASAAADELATRWVNDFARGDSATLKAIDSFNRLGHGMSQIDREQAISNLARDVRKFASEIGNSTRLTEQQRQKLKSLKADREALLSKGVAPSDPGMKALSDDLDKLGESATLSKTSLDDELSSIDSNLKATQDSLKPNIELAKAKLEAAQASKDKVAIGQAEAALEEQNAQAAEAVAAAEYSKEEAYLKEIGVIEEYIAALKAKFAAEGGSLEGVQQQIGAQEQLIGQMQESADKAHAAAQAQEDRAQAFRDAASSEDAASAARLDSLKKEEEAKEPKPRKSSPGGEDDEERQQRIIDQMEELSRAARDGKVALSEVETQFSKLAKEGEEAGVEFSNTILWRMQAEATKVTAWGNLWQKFTDKTKENIVEQTKNLKLWDTGGLAAFNRVTADMKRAMDRDEEWAAQVESTRERLSSLSDQNSAEASALRDNLLALARDGDAMGEAITVAGEKAREALKQIKEEAAAARRELEDMVGSLQDSLDELRGNQAAIENRRYAEELKKIAELESKGGDEAAAKAAEARALSSQLHEEKLAQINEEMEQEKAKADAEVQYSKDRAAGMSKERAEALKSKRLEPLQEAADIRAAQRLLSQGGAGGGGAAPTTPSSITINNTIMTDTTSLLNRDWIRNHLLPNLTAVQRLRG